MAYTQEQLLAAFNKVANKTNWKLPIDKKVSLSSVDEVDLVVEAIIHFTGSVPSYDQLDGDVYHFQAQGYYIAIGA